MIEWFFDEYVDVTVNIFRRTTMFALTRQLGGPQKNVQRVVFVATTTQIIRFKLPFKATLCV
jgi:hypothetical protein